MASPPEYYLIRLDPPPSPILITQNRKANYLWDYSGKTRRGRCEINLLQEGRMRVNRIGSTTIHEEGSVRTLVIDGPQEEVGMTPVVQELFARFFLEIPPAPISEEAVAEWHNFSCEAILPAYVSNVSVCEQVGSVLKNMAALTKGTKLAQDLKMRACLYECLSILTDHAVATARQKLQHMQRESSPHTQKACRFLEEHLSQCPTVQEIAAHVGIGYDYLKRVFQRDMNMTLKEYANLVKIRRVEQLITVENMTLDAAGRSVGIRNPNYISKLFHRFAGVSATEYRRIYQERKNKGLDTTGRRAGATPADGYAPSRSQ